MKADGALRVAIENDQDFRPCPRIPAREPLYALDADGMASAWVRYLFSFSGRFNRTNFWIVYGIVFLTTTIPSVVLRVNSPDNLIAAIFIGLLSLLGSIAILAAATKRLHDLNHSGLWLLPFYAVQLAAFLASPGGLGLMFCTLRLIGLIWLGTARGEKGANRFGADPT
jgi:uncharacterized membrane protein YhaH (DUF805 family)